MDWLMELRLAAHIAYATFLGAIIGWEKNRNSEHHAGMGTYAAVSLGACAFGLVSLHVGGSSDPTRLSAQVVSGIGFLGAGVILRDQGRITGLTTAATIWATASVGLATAYSMVVLATLTTVILRVFRSLEAKLG